MKPVELDLDAIPKRPRKTYEEKNVPVRQHAWWRRIARSLRVDGPQTVAALAKNLGLQKSLVQSGMKYWLRHGIVERVGRRFKLTEAHANYGKLAPKRAPQRADPKPTKPTAWDKVDDLDD